MRELPVVADEDDAPASLRHWDQEVARARAGGLIDDHRVVIGRATTRARCFPFSPLDGLALGLLTITPGEMPQPATRLRRGLFNRLLPGSLDLRQGLADIARHREVSQAQVALNWCRAHGATPIAGLRTPDQAIDVSAALGWMLEAEEIKKLDALAKDCAVGMPANPFQSR